MPIENEFDRKDPESRKVHGALDRDISDLSDELAEKIELPEGFSMTADPTRDDPGVIREQPDVLWRPESPLEGSDLVDRNPFAGIKGSPSAQILPAQLWPAGPERSEDQQSVPELLKEILGEIESLPIRVASALEGLG
jgi:hypothetical protein